MRILGIDPGSRKTGYGLIEQQGASRLVGLDAGILRVDPQRPLEERLQRIYVELQAILERARPDVVAVEDIFFAKHPQAALKLGHVRGVILLVAQQAGAKLAAYPPAVVKRTVGGRGAATKDQIAQLVRAMLGLAQVPGEDATDALAVAITHAQVARFTSELRPPSRVAGRHS